MYNEKIVQLLRDSETLVETESWENAILLLEKAHFEIEQQLWTNEGHQNHSSRSAEEGLLRISKKLRFLLSEKDMKQIQLSRELGVPATTVSNWCKGKTFPRMEALLNLAAFFHVPPSYFLR